MNRVCILINRAKNKYNKIPIYAKAAIWFLFCSFFQKGISVITTPIFTRLMTTDEYGTYNVFQSWLSITTVLVSLQMSSGVYMQGLVKHSETKDQYSSSLQGLTLTLVFIWTVLYTVFQKYINNWLGLTSIQCYSMLILIWSNAAYAFWAVYHRVALSYKKLVVITIIMTIASPVIGIIAVTSFEDKVTARIIGLVIVNFVPAVVFFFSQVLKGKQFFSVHKWGYALSFSLPLIPHYLSQIVLNSSDRIMIEQMTGSSDAGIYSLAYSISQLMTLFNTALLQTFSPWIYQQIKAKQINRIKNIALPILIFVACANLLLIIFAPELVRVFAPKDYYNAIWVIPPVSLSVLFSFAYNLFAAFEFYYKKTTWIAVASVIGALLNVGLNYVFIPVFGYIAAAHTTLFCFIIYAVLHYIFMQKVCKKMHEGEKVYNTSSLVFIAIGFVALGFSIMMTYKLPIIRYLCFALILSLIIIFRKRIISIAKNLFKMKKTGETQDE